MVLSSNAANTTHLSEIYLHWKSGSYRRGVLVLVLVYARKREDLVVRIRIRLE